MAVLGCACARSRWCLRLAQVFWKGVKTRLRIPFRFNSQMLLSETQPFDLISEPLEAGARAPAPHRTPHLARPLSPRSRPALSPLALRRLPLLTCRHGRSRDQSRAAQSSGPYLPRSISLAAGAAGGRRYGGKAAECRPERRATVRPTSRRRGTVLSISRACTSKSARVRESTAHGVDAEVSCRSSGQGAQAAS